MTPSALALLEVLSYRDRVVRLSKQGRWYVDGHEGAVRDSAVNQLIHAGHLIPLNDHLDCYRRGE